MPLSDAQWVRENSHKLSPSLRKRILASYRPVRHAPRFINKLYLGIMHRWRTFPVIVRLDPRALTTFTAREVRNVAGCKIRRNLPLLSAFSTKANMHLLRALAENKNVVRIWFDEEVHAVLDTATPAVLGGNDWWQLDATGKGVTIAVLDTGVYNHPDLQDRIIAFWDPVNNRKKPYDDNGHGTHVAGCAAGNGLASGGLYRAPAPEANIVGIKVLNKTGSGSLSTVIEGIQWCLQYKERYRIRIINLSLGTAAQLPYDDDPVCLAAEKAWEAGILVCAAAGNSGPEPGTINSPGIHPCLLTVGAAAENTGKNEAGIAAFSSRGPAPGGVVKPDVVAPGVDITSLRSPASFLDKNQKNFRVGKDYFKLSGTSMATPLCAGVAALLLQKKNALTPQQVKELLRDTATPLAGYKENDQGGGMINAARALQYLDQI
ncbi:MAG: S8 family peptidase [Firmicutes bacterium]|nr:S8 family peptidase [Bacillota bacterium]